MSLFKLRLDEVVKKVGGKGIMALVNSVQCPHTTKPGIGIHVVGCWEKQLSGISSESSNVVQMFRLGRK